MSDDLKARLAAAQAKKEAAEAKRAQIEESRALAEQVARAEIEAANAEAIAAAEEEHGPIGEGIATCETHGGVIIVKRPNALFYRKITREAGSKNDQKAEDAANRLIFHCLVHPTREEYEALVEKYAGVPGAVIDLIAKLAAGGAKLPGE